MTNRQKAAQETRRKLIEAAKRIISEKGLVNTTTQEITQACGVANGTFYTYFKRKEDIIFEISGEMYSDVYKQTQALDGAFIERLSFFMTGFAGYIEKGSLKICQEWVRNCVDPDIDDTGNKKLRLDIEALQKLIASGIEKGELKADTPAELLARTLVNVLYGQMLCWDFSGGAYGFTERAKEFCDTFLYDIIAKYIEEKTDNA